MQITLRNGAEVDVDLSYLTTLQDVFDAIHAASPYLTASLDPTARAIRIQDASTGTGQLQVQDIYGGLAAEDLGIAGDGPDRHARRDRRDVDRARAP